MVCQPYRPLHAHCESSADNTSAALQLCCRAPCTSAPSDRPARRRPQPARALTRAWPWAASARWRSRSVLCRDGTQARRWRAAELAPVRVDSLDCLSCLRAACFRHSHVTEDAGLWAALDTLKNHERLGESDARNHVIMSYPGMCALVAQAPWRCMPAAATLVHRQQSANVAPGQLRSTREC